MLAPMNAMEPTDENAVLLREVCHRAGNDGAIALAAVRMLGDARLDDPSRRARIVEQATARLEASARLNRLLARPVTPRVDLREWLVATCAELDAVASGGGVIELDLGATWLDGATARRLVLIVTELVSNALKYAGRAGSRVSVRTSRNRVALTVSDDGPGFTPGGPAKGGGLGSGIVADLVRIGGGRLAVETGPRGTVVRVDLPIASTVRPDAERVPACETSFPTTPIRGTACIGSGASAQELGEVGD